MATDLSVVRARPSSTRRSTSSVPTPSGAAAVGLKRSTPAPVAASNPVGALAGGLGQALQSFAKAASGEAAVEHEQKKMSERLKNAETLNKFRREVQTNKDAVLKAIETGDYSELSFNAEEFIDRKVIRDNVHSMVGQAQAYEDVGGLQETINQIDDPMALSDAVAKYIAINTQGVQSDFYATAYGETLMASGRKMIAARQSEIAKTGAAATVETIRGNLSNDLLNPGMEWDADAMVSAADTIADQLVAGGYSPEEGALLAPEMVDKAIIANIGKRPDLLALVNLPDPTREMTTIMDRYPGAVAKAVDQNVADERALMRADGHREINELNRAVTTFGSPLQTMSMEDMFVKLFEIRQDFGWQSPEYQSVESRLLQTRATYFKDQVDISMIMAGTMPPLSDKEWNDKADFAYQQLGNMTPQEQLNTLSVMANHGIDGKLRQRLQRMLNGNEEQQQEASVFIQSLRDASEDGDYDDYLDPLWASKLKVDEYLSEAGVQPAEVTTAVSGVTNKIDPWSYYDQLQTTTKSDGRGVGVQEGQRGSHNVAMEVWDDYVDVWGFNDSPDWRDLPPSVKRLAKDAVNLSAYQQRDMVFSEDDIKAGALRILRGQLTNSHTLENGMVPQQRKGSLMPRDTSPRDREEMLRHQDVFVENASVFNEENENLPDVVATQKDDGYRLGRGELIIVDHGDGAAPRPAFHITGQATTLPDEMIPDAMRDMFVSLDDTVPGVFHGYIAPGVDGQMVPLGNGMALVYNEKNSSWEQRWKPGRPEDVSVSIEDIADGAITDPETETMIGTMGKVRQDLLRRQADRYIEAGIFSEAEFNKMMEDLSGGEGNDSAPATDEEFLKAMHDAITKAEYASFNKNSDRPGGDNGSLIESAGNFITKGEGVRTVAYDDYTGKAILPGRVVKGNPTIGHGFNLNRKDAKKKLEAMGYDYTKIREGRQRISEADGIKLRNMVIQEEMNWLKNKLLRNKVDVTVLTNNQWAAMLSMSYNGRSLITKELIDALKAGSAQEAAKAIKEAKGGAWNRLPTGVQMGLKARRKKEANLFLGFS